MSYSTIHVLQMRKLSLRSLSEIFQGYTCSERCVQVSDPDLYCFKIHAYPMFPCYYLQLTWESYNFMRIISFIMFHSLNNHLLRKNICVHSLNNLLRNNICKFLETDIRCNVLSTWIFFAKGEVWCELSILIIFNIIHSATCYLIYWPKPSQYPFSSGNKLLVQSMKIPVLVPLDQNFTPNYSSFSASIFVTSSLSSVTPLILTF